MATIVAGGLLCSTDASGAESPTVGTTSTSRRVLRFAHPTDIHVQPELGGGVQAYDGAEGSATNDPHRRRLADGYCFR